MSKARGPYKVDPLGYKKANEALNKKAENARELGLDYEPAQPTVPQDIPDLIAGALGVSRGTAYDMMREALAEQPAQQEPVHQFRKRGCSDWYDGQPDHTDGGGPYEARTLYTSPLARHGWTTEQIAGMARLKEAQDKKLSQRSEASTWVGLSDEERNAIGRHHAYVDNIIRATEAKLKEKNT